MSTTRPDVIEILEMEKKYHADQIRRINVAIAALEGNIIEGSMKIEATAHQEQPPQKTTKPIQWAAEIRAIFDNSDILSIEQVRNKLIEKGIVEAMTDSGKNSIYATISRLKGKYLKKTEYGKYQKKPQLVNRIKAENIDVNLYKNQ
jgi:hypothetical protein